MTRLLACVLLAACAGGVEPCEMDADCKLGRVCQAGDCVHERPLAKQRNARPGEECVGEGTFECSLNVVLTCRDGKFEQIYQCLNGEPCGYVFERESIRCGDVWFALPNAACTEQGIAACSFDRTRIFECDGNAWLQVVECASVRQCTVFEENGNYLVDCL